jgi:AraC family transcriptional regulator of adaptative response / DNA-3-methyladenine glycosylase II
MESFVHPLIDPRVCEQARLSRDARFDGLFFIAVTSTGIYCRPVCPAPSPKPANVRYYPNAAAASAAGFRPCLRCRPELAPDSPEFRQADGVIARALKLIHDGALDDGNVAALAQRVNLGERQLRRLFDSRLGAGPVAVHTTRRLLFAKQLLTETGLPITEIALAAGFQSLRRFNACFRDGYRMAPRDLRRGGTPTTGDALRLRLGYRPPYDFPAMLEFLGKRAIPGVERVTATSYERGFGEPESPGWLRVSQVSNQDALQLEVKIAQTTALPGLVTRIRRMFDLDADPQAIHRSLAANPVLRKAIKQHPGQRVPGGFDGFEIAVRAVLGQQVSVAAARTLAARIVRQFAPANLEPDTLQARFPTPAQLVDAPLEGMGITGARAACIRGVARALLEGQVSFAAEQTLDAFVESWTRLPGIGDWTAQYIAMRALSHPDAFPAGDLILRRAAATGDKLLSEKALRTLAEPWRPWRAYAVLHLWRSSAPTPGEKNK